MGDVPMPPAPEPTKADRLADAAATAASIAAENARVFLTGERSGKIRRTILFVLVAVALGSTPWTVLSVIGLVALILLALTDTVVEL